MNQTEFAISDLSYHGENVTKYALGQYKMKAGPGEDTTEGFTDLMEFTKFINETNSNTTVDEWEKHLDTQGFLRW
jgi:spore coat protein CotH